MAPVLVGGVPFTGPSDSSSPRHEEGAACVSHTQCPSDGNPQPPVLSGGSHTGRVTQAKGRKLADGGAPKRKEGNTGAWGRKAPNCGCSAFHTGSWVSLGRTGHLWLALLRGWSALLLQWPGQGPGSRPRAHPRAAISFVTCAPVCW